MGVVNRSEVVLSPWQLRRKLESGLWRELFPGIYWDEPSSPPFRILVDTALVWAGKRAVLSGQSAAAAHGLDGSWVESPISLIIPPSQNLKHTRVRVHRIELAPSEIALIGRRRCTSLARTLLELAAEVSEEALAVAFECAWRRDALVPQIVRHDMLGSMREGSTLLNKVLEDVELRRRPLRSALEVYVWRFLRHHRFPRPEPDYSLWDAEGEMVIDFAYPERKLAVEADGYEFHSSKEAFEKDARRRARLAALDWTHTSITNHDVKHDRANLKTRLRAIFEANPIRRARPIYDASIDLRTNAPW